MKTGRRRQPAVGFGPHAVQSVYCNCRRLAGRLLAADYAALIPVKEV